MTSALGKSVKGYANRPDRGRPFQIKQRNPNQQDDEEQGQKLAKVMQDRKAKLKNAMIEEQKMANFNRMKILTHWRKLLRLAKTE